MSYIDRNRDSILSVSSSLSRAETLNRFGMKALKVHRSLFMLWLQADALKSDEPTLTYYAITAAAGTKALLEHYLRNLDESDQALIIRAIISSLHHIYEALKEQSHPLA